MRTLFLVNQMCLYKFDGKGDCNDMIADLKITRLNGQDLDVFLS
jgi:hypothetical protein